MSDASCAKQSRTNAKWWGLVTAGFVLGIGSRSEVSTWAAQGSSPAAEITQTNQVKKLSALVDAGVTAQPNRSPSLANGSSRPVDTGADLEGITGEDMAEQQELQERSRKGEYILESEYPLRRKRLEAIFQEREVLAPEELSNLEQLFSSFGLASETQAQMENHFGKIQRASAEAELAIGQLLKAQYEYDKELRSLLSATNYAKYREYEDGKRAALEFQTMRTYAKDDGFAFEPAFEAPVRELIRKTQAYTVDTWGGPYDGVPRPMYGSESVAQHADEQVADLTAKLPAIERQARALELPDRYRRFLKDYYTREIQTLRATVERVRHPVDYE